MIVTSLVWGGQSCANADPAVLVGLQDVLMAAIFRGVVPRGKTFKLWTPAEAHSPQTRHNQVGCVSCQEMNSVCVQLGAQVPKCRGD